MADIYVTGHRNPDLDSICSTVMYSKFKNLIDQENHYIPVRCGHMNNQSKYLFEKLKMTPPEVIRDVYPKVKDILTYSDSSTRVNISDPIAEAMDQINDHTVSILPVFDGDKQVGLISVNEIYSFFLHSHIVDRPRYGFNLNNFEKILPGHFLKWGKNEYFNAPIMIGAMPYKVSLDCFRELEPEKPVLVIGERYDLLSYAVSNQFPAIILTGTKGDDIFELDLEYYEGSIFLSERDSAETTRLLQLSISVQEVMQTDYPSLRDTDLFDEAKKKLIGSDYRGLPVYDSNGFLGTVTRRCFIDKPRTKVILVDHNEARQSVIGIEQAQVCEIIDHHRLDANKTIEPIYMAVSPVGSTCTIVYQHYKQYMIPIDKKGAQILLAGILSDTVLLKSPTVTEFDRLAVSDLASIAKIDWKEFGEDLFSQTTVITEVEPDKLISADFKFYTEHGFKIGIGQVEVITLENTGEVREKILEALERFKLHSQLDWVLLLITNVLKEDSLLLSSSFASGEERLIYSQEEEGCYHLPGILSRKKQLLPEVFRVLEEIRQI